MVNWILKLIAKHYISVKTIKDIDHALNRKFADRVKLEGKEHVVSVSNDVTTCVKARLDGYADDGHIDDMELEHVNATDDAVIDKYLTNEKLAEIIELAFK